SFAISPLNSRISVECMKKTSLIYSWRVCVFRANLVGHRQHLRDPRVVDARIGARFAQSRENLFRGDVANQIVSRKGAAAKPRQRAIEAAASRLVGGKDFRFRVLRPAMKMDAQLDSRYVILNLAK